MAVGNKSKLGGSDPRKSAFSRPSEPWGRSRPAAQMTVPTVFPRPQREN